MVSAGAVIAIAERELGVTEDPRGSNSGARVRRYQAATHLAGTGWPWCAAFVEWVWEQAGLRDTAADPSTWWFWKRAEARGEIGPPRPGGAIIWPGTHTGLVVAVDRAAGVVHTIEGNTNDQVARRVRSMEGAVFATPTGLDAGPVEVPLYWLEDVGAEIRVLGPWRLLAWAQRALDGLAPATRAQAAIVRPGTGGYAIRVGRRVYGPWRAQRARDDARGVLEYRLGRRLRPYRTAAPAPPLQGGPAEALGRTT